jgi:poly-gamma-glutamate synthesis protein (capsule biosynthesis protein)
MPAFAGMTMALAAGCIHRPRPPEPSASETPNVFSLTVSTAAPVRASTAPAVAVVVCAGDTNPGLNMAPLLKEQGPAYPYVSVAPFLAGADVMFLNLETPVGTKKKPFPKKYNFLAPPETAAMLTASGVPRVVAGLANNHTLDHGAPALEQTLKILDRLHVKRCGAGRDLAEARKPVFLTVNGSTVAFLAYSWAEPHEFYAGPKKPGTSPVIFTNVREDVAAAKAKARWVIVAVHWGMEYDATVFDYQPTLARIAVDAGADLVVGHHAHTIQGSDVYKGKPIVYGLGNFAFGTANAKAKGAVLKASFLSDGGTRLEIVPVDQNNFRTDYQPRLFQGAELDQALEDVRRLAPSLPWRREGDRLVWP